MMGSVLECENYRNMNILAADYKLPPLSSTETTSVVEIDILKILPNRCFVLLQTYLKKTEPLVPDSLTYSRVAPDRTTTTTKTKSYTQIVSTKLYL